MPNREPPDWLNAALWGLVVLALAIILVPSMWRCATGGKDCPRYRSAIGNLSR